MIFLKEVNDLQQLLHSKRLFSHEPVSIHIAEINSPEVIAAESRINFLKKDNPKWLPIKVMLVTVAVVLGVMINRPDYYTYLRIEFLPVILGIGTFAGVSALFLGNLIKRIKLRNEVRLLLKQIHRLESSYEQNWVFE